MDFVLGFLYLLRFSGGMETNVSNGEALRCRMGAAVYALI